MAFKKKTKKYIVEFVLNTLPPLLKIFALNGGVGMYGVRPKTYFCTVTKKRFSKSVLNQGGVFMRGGDLERIQR